MRTEDHPLEYLDFHGTIPQGNYGAGEMKICDRGVFELEKWRKDEVIVVLHGEQECRAGTFFSEPGARTG